MNLLQLAVLSVHYGAMSLLVLFAAHRVHLVLAAARPAGGKTERKDGGGVPATLCVQLPLYNEPCVVERLLGAAAALRWPQGTLTIQVLDDSTDETGALVDRAAAALRTDGVTIQVLRRTERSGFKAGALAHGLAATDAELVAIFDADFLPAPDFLERAACALADPTVGLVQARWEHLNPRQNLLTRAQAVLLDGHFAVEQPARHALGAYLNFNGTAGIWRRRAIEDAGGWQGDTLTEDLDLSYRAQLAGWRIVYLHDVVAPAELPGEIGGFRSQQHRWAKGGIECLRKLGGRVLGAPIAGRTRLEAAAHLSSNLVYPTLVVVAVSLPVVALLRTSHPIGALFAVDALYFAIGAGSLVWFYLAGARRAGRPALASIPGLLLAIGLDVGIALHKAGAVVEALRGERSPFVRTPKSGRTDTSPATRRSWVGGSKGGSAEVALAAWNAWGFGAVLRADRPPWTALPFLLLFAVSFGAVGLLTLSTSLRRTERGDAG